MTNLIPLLLAVSGIALIWYGVRNLFRYDRIGWVFVALVGVVLFAGAVDLLKAN